MKLYVCHILLVAIQGNTLQKFVNETVHVLEAFPQLLQLRGNVTTATSLLAFLTVVTCSM